jgi:hypothetical protein
MKNTMEQIGCEAGTKWVDYADTVPFQTTTKESAIV